MVKKKKKTAKKATKKKTSKKKTAKKVSKKKTTKKATKKKATKKKVTKKKVTKKKVAKKKSTAAPAPVSRSVASVAKKVKKARTKNDLLGVLADSTGMSKKDVAHVLEKLGDLISLDVGKGPGVFTIPGLVKVVRVHKPATKARKGINPFTKEPMMFKAKPARNIVRVRALKHLKDSV
jgi:hypothetical protein